jgi:para-nitrobenzyl esterase
MLRVIAPLAAIATFVACSSDPIGIQGQPDSGQAAQDAGAEDPDAGGGSLCQSAPSSDPLVVATDRGNVRGTMSGQTKAFLGIPYAAPPVGELRFELPEAHACWEGERDATRYGARCPQVGRGMDTSGEEDCLSLNVWTKDTGASKPVLFFIHGGAYVIGASNEPLAEGYNLYDGKKLAEEQDVVVVSINYRLGALGFLAHPAFANATESKVSGNFALYDMIFALRWVKENIARFGGDPARVTIFGESAGALSVCLLVASPLARDLFAGAIMESGACWAAPKAQREMAAQRQAESLGCDSTDPAEVVRCLREAPASRFVALAPETPSILSTWDLPFGATIDGRLIPGAPLEIISRGEHNKVPIVVGSNAHEAELFTPPTINTCFDYEVAIRAAFPDFVDQIRAEYPCFDYPFARWAFVDAMTDVSFTCPARRALRAFATQADVPAYRYLYSYVRRDPFVIALRAFHSGELPLVFGTMARPGYEPPPIEEEVSSRVRAAWGRFAHTSDPNVPGLLPWPRWDAASDPAWVVDEMLGTTAAIKDRKCTFWDMLSE